MLIPDAVDDARLPGHAATPPGHAATLPGGSLDVLEPIEHPERPGPGTLAVVRAPLRGRLLLVLGPVVRPRRQGPSPRPGAHATAG